MDLKVLKLLLLLCFLSFAGCALEQSNATSREKSEQSNVMQRFFFLGNEKPEKPKDKAKKDPQLEANISAIPDKSDLKYDSIYESSLPQEEEIQTPVTHKQTKQVISIGKEEIRVFKNRKFDTVKAQEIENLRNQKNY